MEKLGRRHLLVVAVMFSFLISSLWFANSPHPPVINASTVVDTGDIDWRWFWKLFNSVALWDLEYSADGNPPWTSRKDLMQIIRDYPSPNHCKITLNFTSDEAGSYRLTFAVKKKVKDYVDKSSQYCYELSFHEYHVTFNWSDVIGISGLELSRGMKNGYFWFRMKRDGVPANFNLVIDPSIIGTIDTWNYGKGFQRKSFNAQGYFFQFYQNNTGKIYYASSPDGDTWSDGTYFKDGNIRGFSLWYDGSTYVHTVLSEAAYGGDINYTRGQPQNDGTISWDATQNVLQETGWLSWEPCIAIDSSNYPYIFTHWEKGSAYCSLMIKSSTNDGTSTTDAGYPMNLSINDDEPISQIMLPLTSTKMYAIWAPDKATDQIYGRLYNGSDWESNVTIANLHSSYLSAISAVSKSDEIHLVFVDDADDTKLQYINYTSGSWGTEETVVDFSVADYISMVSIEDADTEFFVYANYLRSGESVIYTDYYRGTSGNWDLGTTISWNQDMSSNGKAQLTSFRQNWAGYHACTVITWNQELEFWSDGTPTNDACDSTATFTLDSYGWVNVTVSDIDYVADLNYVQIQVNTTGDAETFTLKYNQTSDVFTEVSDSSGVCTLDAGTSTRVNIDSDTDKIAYYFKFSTEATQGNCDVTVSSYDDSALSDTDTYSNEFTLAGSPSIGEFQAPSTIYAYQEVMLNCTVVDLDGNTTLKNASLTLSVNSVVLGWVNITNTFSMTDPNNKWELVSGSRTTVNSTSYRLTWNVKSYWNSTEGYVSISSATVYDGDDNSGSNSESDWFYNENDLEIDSANVDDSHVDPSQILSFNGQIYYESTSTAPYTTSGITARIELSSVLKGSNSSIGADGSFTIGFNAESTFIEHTYNVYSLTSKTSVQNQTVNVIVDRVNVTISANTTTPYVSETVDFTVTGVYHYDGTTVSSWTVNINRNTTHYATGNFTDMQTTEIIYSYTTENVTENTYGLSTFNSNTENVGWLGKWDVNLQARDYEDNILTDAVIYMDNGTEYSKTVDSQGWANWTDITADTVDVYAKWNGYTVNNTFTLTLDSEQTVNVTCKTYPFTLDGTRYWIAGNATVNTYSWNGTTEIFVVSFSDSVDTYTYKSSATSKPTYVLNCTYDLDNDWDTLLTLTHYANHTLTIAYPTWASTRIYRCDHIITNAYWTEEILYVTLNGTSGQSGTLEVYCGGRGPPTNTEGLSDTVYFSGTTIMAGTYTFSSSVTVSFDWTTTGGGGGGGSTPSIFATAETIDLGPVQQGTSKTFNASASWTGSTSITLADVTFTGLGSEWLTVDVTFPYTVKRLAIETTGDIQVPITLMVPSQAKLGDYKVLVEYEITVSTRTYETTAQLLFTVTATPVAPTGTPLLVSAVLLISLVGVVFIGVKKR